jgi:peptidoglycan hydrolase-like protein with peptidoglycan-binding domain
MSRTLRVGCKGADVAAVQDALNQIGANGALPDHQTTLPLLAPDGIFGNKTFIRVKDFQHMNGLAADGVVGPVTLSRLEELLPAVQTGMSTSRPTGLVHDPNPLGWGKPQPHPVHPAIHPNPFDFGEGKSTGSGSKTSSSSSGIKTSSSGGKTSKW